jgi:hypothetical protein
MENGMPVATLRVTDETAVGDIINELTISLHGTVVTVKDIITARVEEEIDRIGRQAGQSGSKLVEPSQVEKILNESKTVSNADVEKEVYAALAAFQKNGFFVLIDDHQVDDLDQEFEITSDTKASFLKITPLVGG